MVFDVPGCARMCPDVPALSLYSSDFILGNIGAQISTLSQCISLWRIKKNCSSSWTLHFGIIAYNLVSFSQLESNVCFTCLFKGQIHNHFFLKKNESPTPIDIPQKKTLSCRKLGKHAIVESPGVIPVGSFRALTFHTVWLCSNFSMCFVFSWSLLGVCFLVEHCVYLRLTNVYIICRNSLWSTRKAIWFTRFRNFKM